MLGREIVRLTGTSGLAHLGQEGEEQGNFGPLASEVRKLWLEYLT